MSPPHPNMRQEVEVRDVEAKRGEGRAYQGMYTRFSSESHDMIENEERREELGVGGGRENFDESVRNEEEFWRE